MPSQQVFCPSRPTTSPLSTVAHQLTLTGKQHIRLRPIAQPSQNQFFFRLRNFHITGSECYLHFLSGDSDLEPSRIPLLWAYHPLSFGCFSIELFALLIFSWKSYGKTSEPEDGPRTSGQHAGSIFVFLGIHICFFFPSTKSIKYSLSAYTLQGCQVKTELTHMPLFLRSSRVHQLLWRAQETNLHSEAHSPKAYLSWFAPPIPTLHFHYAFPNSCLASLMHSFSFSLQVLLFVLCTISWLCFLPETLPLCTLSGCCFCYSLDLEYLPEVEV